MPPDLTFKVNTLVTMADNLHRFLNRERPIGFLNPLTYLGRDDCIPEEHSRVCWDNLRYDIFQLGIWHLSDDIFYDNIFCVDATRNHVSFWQHQSLFFPMYFCYTCNVSLYIFVHFVLLFSFTFKFTDSVMQMVEYPQLLCSCSGLLCPSTSLNIRNGGNRQWCRRVLPVSCWYRKRFKPYLINFCWFWTWNQKFLWLTLHRALRYKVSHQKWGERIHCTYSQYSKYKCKIWQSLSSYK